MGLSVGICLWTWPGVLRQGRSLLRISAAHQNNQILLLPQFVQQNRQYRHISQHLHQKASEHIIKQKNTQVVKVINMNGDISQTLEESKQIEKRYQQFLKKKQQSDRQWAETEKRLEQTLGKIAETKDSLRKVDEMFDNFQKAFENVLDKALYSLQGSSMFQIGDQNFSPTYLTKQIFMKVIQKKKRILVITGAGMSVASGIPTFRGDDGYWTKKKEQNVDPQSFLTLSNFTSNEFDIWQWVDNFYQTKMGVKYNQGHIALDKLCNHFRNEKKEVAIVTQNIDNFHIEAQKQEKYSIYEIHGNALKIRCDACPGEKLELYQYSDFREKIIKQRISPLCPKCQAKMRPHIMFFDEFYSQKNNGSQSIVQFLEKQVAEKKQQVPAKEKRKSTDLLIVIGTALETGLSSSLVSQMISEGADIIEVNTKCIIKRGETYWGQGKSEDILGNMINWIGLNGPNKKIEAVRKVEKIERKEVPAIRNQSLKRAIEKKVEKKPQLKKSPQKKNTPKTLAVKKK